VWTSKAKAYALEPMRKKRAEIRPLPGRRLQSNLPRGGTEFTSMAILKWVQETDVDWHYIASRCPAVVCLQTMRGGKPQQNGFIESFKRRLRNGVFGPHNLSSRVFHSAAISAGGLALLICVMRLLGFVCLR
jgi:transposase InsO family protein